MKIEELIEYLTAQKEKYGNVPVAVYCNNKQKPLHHMETMYNGVNADGTNRLVLLVGQ